MTLFMVPPLQKVADNQKGFTPLETDLLKKFALSTVSLCPLSVPLCPSVPSLCNPYGLLTTGVGVAFAPHGPSGSTSTVIHLGSTRGLTISTSS